MPTNDPTESGGLFSRRTSGLRPLRYRGAPSRGGTRRRLADRTLANAILVLEVLICLTIFGPQPYAWFWIGSQVQYLTGTVSAGIATIMFGSLASLMLTVMLLKWLDDAWKIVRRAAGYDQKQGVLEMIFVISVGIAVVVFTFWFLVFVGPNPTIAPTN